MRQKRRLKKKGYLVLAGHLLSSGKAFLGRVGWGGHGCGGAKGWRRFSTLVNLKNEAAELFFCHEAITHFSCPLFLRSNHP